MQELDDLKGILDTHGVHETLRELNSRTPHRFTGIYRFDGGILRNLHLVDQFNPDVRRGDDVPIQDAYCSLLSESDPRLEFAEVQSDPHVAVKPGKVVSYCGVLIRNADGTPFGSLCHYDVKPCQKRMSDVPLLEAIAPALLGAVQG